MCNALLNTLTTGSTAQDQRHAYNAAFDELCLSWHWDAATYARLQVATRGRESVRNYLEAEHPHLLRAYEADFLVSAIETAKDRCLAGMANLHRPTPHPAWAGDAMRLAA